MICPKCKIEMQLGIAIDTGPYGHNCILCTSPALINKDTLKIVDVLKCPKCGHSDDGVEIPTYEGKIFK